MPLNIEAYRKGIDEFCHRWKVTELSLFGSVIRDDFQINSDVDVLVEFPEDIPYSLFDLVTMQEELQALFRREVDLVEKGALRNPFRRRAILNNRKIIYVS